MNKYSVIISSASFASVLNPPSLHALRVRIAAVEVDTDPIGSLAEPPGVVPLSGLLTLGLIVP